ncbi:putative plastid light harvesting protein [Pelagophyceae sp. CCMP2097]|nr:putative plastid light harvesting protein [Pelagophyceae sp. CCMP2097]
MKFAVALLASGACVDAFVGVSPAFKTTLKSGEMDLDLEAMFEIFESADSGNVALLVADMRGPAPGLAQMEGASLPLPGWDPAGFSKLGDERSMAWFKAAELKHSRVCMAASVGWIVNEMGITFPGDVAHGVSFASLGKGVDAWDALPSGGKLQILAAIGAAEFFGETGKPHYMKGGVPGEIPGPFGLNYWDFLGTYKSLSPEDKKARRQSEINNGRLAMIGVASFFSASYIDGSVPSLPSTW